MKKIIGFVIIIIVLVFVGWLGASVFMDKTDDRELPDAIEVMLKKSDKIPSAELAAVEDLTAQVDQTQQKYFVEEMEEVVMEDTKINEKIPGVSQEVIVRASGNFEDVSHQGSGIAQLLDISGQEEYVLRLENLDVLNGPDLHVLLSPNKNVELSTDLGAYVDIGVLKGNKGNQNYTIFDDFEIGIENFKSVVIYSKAFDVVFNSADLTWIGKEVSSDTKESDVIYDMADPIEKIVIGNWLVQMDTNITHVNINADHRYDVSHDSKPAGDVGVWSVKNNKLLFDSELGLDRSFSDIHYVGSKLSVYNDENGETEEWVNKAMLN